MSTPTLQPVTWERMIRAVEKVRERLLKATAALEAAGVPYAVIGGNAVAAWVSRVDEAAVRNTADVNILLRRSDFPAAKAALEAAGFRHRRAAGIDMFLEGDSKKAREAVHVLFAGEKVRPEYPETTADVSDSVYAESANFKHLTLEALLRMKLTSNRDKDRTHVRDLIGVGLIDESWLSKVPPSLAPRLREILDNPEPDLSIEFDDDGN